MIIDKIRRTIKAYYIRTLATIIRRKKYYDKYIVLMDGGLCSQITQYLLGKILMEQGYKVEYDITWFQNNPKDVNGIYERKYELNSLFHDIDLSVVSEKERNIYYKYLINEENTYLTGMKVEQITKKPPLYLSGYYDINEYLFRLDYTSKYTHFKDVDKLLSQEEMEIYQEIKESKKSVGVHVRRGDMAKTESYWRALEPTYFVNVMTLKQYENADFFFFSDEIDWVKKQIIPLLPENLSYKLIDVNKDQKGYVDFYLLSSCMHQISSQGSFGKIAYLYNRYEDRSLVYPIDESKKDIVDYCKNKNVIFVDYSGNITNM